MSALAELPRDIGPGRACLTQACALRDLSRSVSLQAASLPPPRSVRGASPPRATRSASRRSLRGSKELGPLQVAS